MKDIVVSPDYVRITENSSSTSYTKERESIYINGSEVVVTFIDKPDLKLLSSNINSIDNNGSVLVPDDYDTSEKLRTLAEEFFTPPTASLSGGITFPPGMATSANQNTGNASLSSIDGKLDSQSTATKQDEAKAELEAIKNAVEKQSQNTIVEVQNITVSGNTETTDVICYSIVFLGSGGSFQGVPVPDGWGFDSGNNVTGVSPFTVPTTGEQRVIINYTKSV